MTESQYKFKAMQKTQSIPVHWKFSQDDYDKLIKGHQSNWSVFLRNDMVHVCRLGGEEFYRFAISKSSDGAYTTDNLEVYMPDDFYKFTRLHEWTKEKVEKHQVDLKESAVEETIGLLRAYFDIDFS